MGGKQSKEVRETKQKLDEFYNYTINQYPIDRKKILDIIDSSNSNIDNIQKIIQNINKDIYNKLMFKTYINDYYEIKEKYLDLIEDFNNLNKIILNDIKKIDEKIKIINEIYYNSISNNNYIFNNIFFINNEVISTNNLVMNSQSNQFDTIQKTNIKWINLDSEYLSLKNRSQCLEPTWPNLYQDKCYSKCPIDSIFTVDISGNPKCNTIETIIEDKTLDKEVYKCQDGYIYKKDSNGKEFCISCPENYMYIKNENENENDNGYCLENCPLGYVLDKDNICKINKEYKLIQTDNKQPEICPIGYSIKELQSNYQCIEDCQIGYVLDKDNICRPGYSPKEKNLCPSGYKLNKVNNQYICVKDCSENYKLDKDNICKYVNSYTPIISNYNTVDISCNNNDYINGSCYKKCEQNYSTYSKDPTKCVIDTCVKPFERIEVNNRIYCHQIQNKQFTPNYKNDYVPLSI